ncbi:MAG: hypothetical protein DRP84_01405 [Spirochaetes bacterium]|nr:MAG: hypothetical protein DRP84_01405 [Spirochaetota bacterium]
MANIKDLINQASFKALPTRDRMHIFFRNKLCPFERIEPYVPKEGRILDYGCGHGLFSWWMKASSPERDVIGYDVCSRKISLARNLLEKKYGIQFFDNREYFSSMSFDAVVAVGVLYLIKEKREIISMLKSLIKSEGYIILKEVVKENSLRFAWTYFEEVMAAKIFRITEGEGLFFLTKDEILNILEECGFSVQMQDLSRGYWYPHMLFIGKKK